MSVLLALLILVPFALLAWRDLRLGVILFAALLPTYLLRFSFLTLPTTLLEILLGVLLLIWFLQRATYPLRRERLRPWLAPCSLLLIAGIVGVAVAPELRAALGLFRAYILEPLLFFALLLSVAEESLLRCMSQALVISGSCVALVALVQQALGPTYLWEGVRSTSVYPFPNAVGLFLAPLVVLAVGATFMTPRQGAMNRAPTTIAAVLMLAAIVGAQSEGAIVGVLTGLFVLGLLHAKTRRATVIAALIAAALAVIIPQTRAFAAEKLLLRDWSGTVRRITWDETLTMLRDRPVFGAGLSGYPTAMRRYHTATAIEIFQYPHNLFLNVWSELGILGIVTFGWILVTFLRLAWPHRHEPYARAALAAMVVILVHGLVDVPYFKNDLAFLFWIIVALGTAGALPKIKKTLP